jgi:hypothetical protein
MRAFQLTVVRYFQGAKLRFFKTLIATSASYGLSLVYTNSKNGSVSFFGGCKNGPFLGFK